nr:ASKHA domain-containing protein [Prolixibacteraceae bacterium]
DFLEDLPVDNVRNNHLSPAPYGVAIDLGTTTVVLYFMDMVSGKIEKIASFVNPQISFGADVISRISYCQTHPDGLGILQQLIVDAINHELNLFSSAKNSQQNDVVELAIAGNTTMLHLLLGIDPEPIALAPFKPRFVDKQSLSGRATSFAVHPEAEIITLPCISAYCGADLVAGLAALKTDYRSYLFVDIGTNGEIALVDGDTVYVCAAAAGPTFEGANISCGKSATPGAIASFRDPNHYEVIDGTEPNGICGSGIIDVMAFLLKEQLVTEDGLLAEPFVVHRKAGLVITQEDVREIQLAKSAIYSGMKILLKQAGKTFHDLDALFLAGGFGNYIHIAAAIRIGLLPREIENKIHPIGNSSAMGALQFLKSRSFEEKVNEIIKKAVYIELSGIDDFAYEFALNMNFNPPVSP